MDLHHPVSECVKAVGDSMRLVDTAPGRMTAVYSSTQCSVIITA